VLSRVRERPVLGAASHHTYTRSASSPGASNVGPHHAGRRARLLRAFARLHHRLWPTLRRSSCCSTIRSQPSSPWGSWSTSPTLCCGPSGS